MVALEVVRPASAVNELHKPMEKKKAVNVSPVEEYCSALGGTDPIRSILIANNGMAAVKFMRSVRSWAYESFGVERAVLLVAMATPEDMRINAEHIRMADQFVEVPGGTNNNNYANVQLIVEVCAPSPCYSSLQVPTRIVHWMVMYGCFYSLLSPIYAYWLADCRENRGASRMAWMGSRIWKPRAPRLPLGARHSVPGSSSGANECAWR